MVGGDLVCDGSEDHGVRHQRVSVDQPLRLGEVLHRDSEHQLVVEAATSGLKSIISNPVSLIRLILISQ